MKKKNITSELSITETAVLRNLNKSSLSRVLNNIINNTIQHSDGDLSITLLDTGECIFTNHARLLDKTQVGKLFDRFYTVETAANSTGIGLAIAKSLTEQMHGKINASYHDGCLSIHLFI